MYGCLVYANGSVKVIDTWNPKSKLINVLDEPQTDVCSNAAEYDGEKITCKYVLCLTLVVLIIVTIIINCDCKSSFQIQPGHQRRHSWKRSGLK